MVGHEPQIRDVPCAGQAQVVQELGGAVEHPRIAGADAWLVPPDRDRVDLPGADPGQREDVRHGLGRGVVFRGVPVPGEAFLLDHGEHLPGAVDQAGARVVPGVRAGVDARDVGHRPPSAASRCGADWSSAGAGAKTSW